MSANNINLWDSVCTTDIEHTRKVNQRGGYTAIDPTYQAREATKQFGAYGSGWGLSMSVLDFSILESYGLIIHKAVFFYTLNGERVEFPITNSINPGKKERPDSDFAKKVETNTVSKALSKLGFNADVFLGMFEDDLYIETIANEQALEKADSKIEEQAKQKEEYDKWVASNVALITTAASMNELEKLFVTVVRKMKTRKDDGGILIATKAKDERKAELAKKEGK